jgi:hypothetical protein
MNSKAKSYAIYDLKTGQVAACLSSEGTLDSEGDPEALAVLTALLQHDIVIREHHIDYDPQHADDDFDPYPEEQMCYFGMVTLRPGDPSFLQAFLTRLPYISHYEARLSE